MNIEEMLSRHITDSHSDDRNEESVKAALIHALSASSKISGSHEFSTGFMKLSQALIQNKQFDEAIDKIVQIVLLLFPVTKLEAVSDLKN